jgi:geranylgeranyl diphosphate synthase type I
MTPPLTKLSNILLPEIETKLRQTVSLAREGGTQELHDMLAYHMGWEDENASPNASGKRIRPLLVVLTAGSTAGEWRDSVPAAAAVELVHNFSLIHDDIEDNSPLRRGRPTVWKRWGIAQAINCGDSMLTLANIAILRLSETTGSEITNQAAAILQDTCLHLTQGQYLDLSYETRTDITIDEYWRMIRGKTAALIGTCTELGAVVARASGSARKSYRDFGVYLGLAFQVQDDLLGVWGDAHSMGKSVESDLVAGKKSLPVVYGLNQDGAFARRWKHGSIFADEVPHLAGLLEDEGARAYTQERASHYTQKALDSLSKAGPSGEFGDALVDLAEQLLNRSN